MLVLAARHKEQRKKKAKRKEFIALFVFLLLQMSDVAFALGKPARTR